MPPPVPTSAPGPLPERLGQRFTLGELIGRGTCSEVYRAHDLLLDRDAAVKIFPVADDPRIEREVSLTASMDHPNLVPVYDVGGVNGRAFVVMALLEGGNLADRLADGPLPVAETLLAVAAVADALGHVHRAGVLHRDVTPRNVLFDSDGRAHLSDFGVAFVADAPRITDTGIVVGSAPYLAPEQVRGETVGPPADVYALGLVMIEALTGRPAYEGAPLAAARERLERRPEVPEGLDFEIVTLLEAMTADDPAHRPPAENVCIGLRRAALAAETLPANGAPLPFAGLGLSGLVPATTDTSATTDTFATAGAAAPHETPGREPRPVLARSGGLVVAASVAAAVLLAGGVVVASAWTVDGVAASGAPAATLAPPTAEIVADPGPGSLVGRGSGGSEVRDESRGSRGEDEPVTVRRGSSASQRAAATTSTDGGAESSAPRRSTSAAPTTETSPEPTRETTPETPSSEPSESTEPSPPSLAPGLPLPSVSLALPTGTSSTTGPAPSSSSTSSSTSSNSTTSNSTTSNAAPSSTTGVDATSSNLASGNLASGNLGSGNRAPGNPTSRTGASSDGPSSTTTSPTAPKRAAARTDPAVEALGGVLGSR
ncbi:protein kinase domain-containing protein [Actinomycetospora chibensis]|uniref:non-specific serine/threonine protein kinase n=1 Tax=Actinomycetospora chibensis TaxID=663606 RepID=A0ABV9RNJ6_9PSEU|nr:protein kinase [Actinomycetospora chibensis]MDD7923179.1 protein kinase [Actinomycetospora chibensis]